MAFANEERIGSLIAGGGLIWAARTVANSMLPAYAVELTVGPIETCSIGILIWLHAKWRRLCEAHRAAPAVR